MTKAELDILKEIERTEIPDHVINAITKKLISVMNKRIENISPNDDQSADYGKSWTNGSCDGEDWLELDGQLDEYDISYHYELSWRYRTWTEYWTDPACAPSFDEMADERGKVYGISIYTPDGDEVNDSICERIAKTVNEKITRK